MSGICGIVHWDERSVDVNHLTRMSQAAAYRGPDGIRYRTCSHAGFGHLALHITPESVREQQPLCNAEGQLLLTADARLDNRQELIKSLAAKGLPFEHAANDAELILAAYRVWGAECASHLIGDFAFAIWDASQRRLFAARDPMAMRALYYRTEPKRFLFGTEVKQILAAPDVPVRVFEPALAAYLAGSFDHLDWTFYEGVEQLPPGHALLADARGVRAWRYWDIDPQFQIEYKDERQYADHFLEIFKDAVGCRLRSAKPVGILLSGGMDSGSVASMAGRLLERNGSLCPEFHAYSWAFDELPECDERHISDGIVRNYGFPVTYVDAGRHWPLKDYPAHGPDRDEPFVGVYQALLEESMRAARDESVRLLISGDRGDLVAGEYIYDYPGLLRSGQWATLVRELRLRAQWANVSFASAAWKHLISPRAEILWPPANAPRIRKEFARAFRRLRGRKPSYPPWIRPEFARRVNLDEILQTSSNHLHLSGSARRKRYSAIFASMHSRGVVWSERTQARFGLGFADAWSDRRLAQFAVAVPQRILNRTGENKYLVRKAMYGIMPEEVRLAARKIVPEPLYMKALTKTARETVISLLECSRAAGFAYVNEAELRKCYDQICDTQQDVAGFWWALTLMMWLRQHWA